jgi:DDE superfamily endonuclease
VLPPKANAAFVAATEDVLDVYARSYDPRRLQVCFDEGGKQLVGDVRLPLPVQPGQPRREDYEYERNGRANLFMEFEPLAGIRRVEVTERRTNWDFARVVRQMVAEWSPEAEQVVLVLDNLSTPPRPRCTRRSSRRRPGGWWRRSSGTTPPRHGSWLNVAEVELGVLERQCLDRRIPNLEALRREAAAWQQSRNAAVVRVHWQFTTADARVKLKRLYPTIELQ